MRAEEDLRRWLSNKTGIELGRGGVYRALSDVVARRAKELGCSVEEYACRAQLPGSTEFDVLANSVTVVYTWFFRDPKQLEAIQELLRRWTEPRPVRIWIPGCATGEDAYSLAMIADGLGVPVTILGTDLNSSAVRVATEARYTQHDLRNLDSKYRRYFSELPSGGYTVAPRLRQRVGFRRHNLVEPVPEHEGRADWDIILCRNVLIYFDAPRALDVFQRMTRSLTLSGHLLLGASEIVYDVPTDLEVVQVAQRLVLARSSEPPKAKLPAPGHAVPTSLGRGSSRPASSARSKAPLFMSTPPALLTKALGTPAPAPAKTERATAPVSETWVERGHALLEASRVDEAVELYTRALASDPICAEALMYRGVAHYLGGDVEAAAHDLRAALFLDGGLLLGTYYLALSYESMGLADDALREFRHLVRVGGSEGQSGPKVTGLWAGWSRDILELARRRLEAVSKSRLSGR